MSVIVFLPSQLRNQRTDPQEMLFLLDQNLPAGSVVGTGLPRQSSLSFLSVGGIPGPGFCFNWQFYNTAIFCMYYSMKTQRSSLLANIVQHFILFSVILLIRTSDPESVRMLSCSLRLEGLWDIRRSYSLHHGNILQSPSAYVHLSVHPSIHLLVCHLFLIKKIWGPQIRTLGINAPLILMPHVCEIGQDQIVLKFAHKACSKLG